MRGAPDRWCPFSTNKWNVLAEHGSLLTKITKRKTQSIFTFYIYSIFDKILKFDIQELIYYHLLIDKIKARAHSVLRLEHDQNPSKSGLP